MHLLNKQLTKISTMLAISQQTELISKLRITMHQINLAKIIEINSNLGVRKSPPRFQARCSIEGLTGMTLGLQRL